MKTENTMNCGGRRHSIIRNDSTRIISRLSAYPSMIVLRFLGLQCAEVHTYEAEYSERMCMHFSEVHTHLKAILMRKGLQK